MKDDPYVILAKEIIGFLEIHLKKVILAKDAVAIGNTSAAFSLLDTSTKNLSQLIEKVKRSLE